MARRRSEDPPMAKLMGYAMGALGACLLAGGVARAGTVNEDHGIAIKGYDPVAYFTDNKPVKGSKAHSFAYQGATYEFASAAHRKAFAADPEKYAPQFGGFCAYGTATGHKADIDPAAFSIVEGKLYLNYSTKVRGVWRKDEPGYIRKADEAWPSVSQQTEVVR
jgi:YHS domain-containing protein